MGAKLPEFIIISAPFKDALNAKITYKIDNKEYSFEELFNEDRTCKFNNDLKDKILIMSFELDNGEIITQSIKLFNETKINFTAPKFNQSFNGLTTINKDGIEYSVTVENGKFVAKDKDGKLLENFELTILREDSTEEKPVPAEFNDDGIITNCYNKNTENGRYTKFTYKLSVDDTIQD